MPNGSKGHIAAYHNLISQMAANWASAVIREARKTPTNIVCNRHEADGRCHLCNCRTIIPAFPRLNDTKLHAWHVVHGFDNLIVSDGSVVATAGR